MPFFCFSCPKFAVYLYIFIASAATTRGTTSSLCGSEFFIDNNSTDNKFVPAACCPLLR
ncbi:hypothetical protein BOX15_Mlig000133g2 [Macrostomum lignano]|uniref:Uncharacterized protein n=1 Tax=Macrostomum lignano TaxID=282301 RepID=A0A267EFQ3_9PLAT|nr:hypothetical protein BOX15_Mlig000133g3 [Macrostomum lignano]PAA59784.1 hypothetical protein BOX15_Mlig000133g2 [Macrostomum lignano]